MTRPITEGCIGLSRALLTAGVVTDRVEVTLPHDEWWRLYCALDRELGHMVRFDGRGLPPIDFKFLGVVYKVRTE